MTKEDKCRVTQLGRVVIHKGNQEKRIYKHQLQDFLKLGWTIGYSETHKKRLSELRMGKAPSNKGQPCSSEKKEKIRQTLKKKNQNQKFKENTGWTKYWINGGNTKEKIQQITKKQQETKEKNNTFNTSKPETSVYLYLKKVFANELVYRNYKSERYPYRCDFYIKSEDLFIELNLHWTHGPHPFDENNPEDIVLLNKWKEKAKTSKFYEQAIYVWTVLDKEKIKVAQINNLNYKLIYTKENFEELKNSLKQE